MATWYAQQAYDWNANSGGKSTIWFDATSGGNAANYPLTVTDTYNLNGQAVTTTTGATYTAALITASGATGSLAITGTVILAAAVTYSGTATTGMITVGTGANLTINGQVTNSSTGRAIVGSGSGVCAITNVGGTACSNTSTGRVVNWVSTGNLTITGNVAHTGSTSSTGYYAIGVSANAAVLITGDVSATGGYGVYFETGTITLDGNMSSVGVARAVHAFGGTFVWSPNSTRTIGAGQSCVVYCEGGVLTFTNVLLTNSGVFAVVCLATATVNHSGFVITNQSADAQAAILGHAITIIGPTLPAAVNVATGSGAFGYANALTPSYQTTAATQLADANTLEAEKAYLLETKTITFGASHVDGTLAVGNVLTTVTGGAYVAAADANVRYGVANGVAPGAGTLVVPGMASNGAVLAKETGANARGGSGTCAKLTPPAGAVIYGYWDFYVPVTDVETDITFYWAKSAAGFDGLLKVSVWDTDNATPLTASEAVDITAADTAYHLATITVTPSDVGLCRVRIELKDGATSGFAYFDDVAIAVHV